MLTDTQLNELLDLLVTLNQDTKIYLGCDSVRFVKGKVKMARYATVLVVHMNGKNGCRVFSNITFENDYDVKANRPAMRLMNEVIKVCELYNQVAPLIDDFEIQVHLDVNTDPMHGSNCVAAQAAGYVLGVTGIEPKMKPFSWAASFSADAAAHGRMAHTFSEEAA